MRIINSLLAVILVLSMWSCESNEGLVIKGNISDANSLSIYMDRVSVFGQPEILTNTQTTATGDFEMKFPQPLVAGHYSLRIGAKNADLVLSGKESEVIVTGSLDDMAKNKYKVEGSELTQEYLSTIQTYLSGEKQLQDFLHDLQNNAEPMVSSIIVGKLFNKSAQLASIHRKITDRLTDKYGETKYTQSVESFTQSMEQGYRRMLAQQLIKLGAEAPEIALPGVDGEIRKLSDYRGKLVLLDFWAAWCGPCRQANPHVVELYNKYKDQGFDVFSVSLDGLDSKSKARLKNEQQIKMNMDRQKERWVQAIKKDNLTWDGHVSDLKKWESEAAALYGVKGIPKTFLIDRDGKIVEIDPRFNLEEAIKKHI